MNERTTLCVGSWQAAMSLGIIEIIDDTEHSYALSLYSWFNMEQKRCLEERLYVVLEEHRLCIFFSFKDYVLNNLSIVRIPLKAALWFLLTQYLVW